MAHGSITPHATGTGGTGGTGGSGAGGGGGIAYGTPAPAPRDPDEVTTWRSYKLSLNEIVRGCNIIIPRGAEYEMDLVQGEDCLRITVKTGEKTRG